MTDQERKRAEREAYAATGSRPPVETRAERARRLVLVEGKSMRAAAKEMGVSANHVSDWVKGTDFTRRYAREYDARKRERVAIDECRDVVDLPPIIRR